MIEIDLPLCCSPLQDRCPLGALPEARFVSTRFDPLRLEAGDFARCAIPPVKGVAKRQAEYLAGRLCAREALRRLDGLDVVPAIGADRAPQWPAGVSGSITHGQGVAAAVVAHSARWRGLGLDVERPLDDERAQRLAAEILTGDELQRLNALPEAQRAWRVSLTFSLKESLYKALYPLVLRHFYFHDAELLSSDEDGNARLRLLIDLAPEWPAGSELAGRSCRFDDHLLSLVAVGA